MIPQVNIEDARAFSKQWTHQGVAIFLDAVHLQFATDYANIVLQGFVNMLAEQQRQAAQPKVILAE